MKHRSLGRIDDRALAALSAALYVPMRRIGFLVMPPIWCFGGGLPIGAMPTGRGVSQILSKKSSRAFDPRCKNTINDS
jgi:hypothetical protein